MELWSGKVRVGIIGTGKFGENHIRILKELGHEVYIFDTDKKRQLEMAEKYNVADFFVDSIMDAVIVATPSDIHYEVTKPLLEKGINVLVEKPLCLHTDEAKELVELAEKNDVILATGTVFRFTPGAVEFKAIVDNLNVKKIVMRFYNTKPPRSDSNILFNLGIHYIDLLLSTDMFKYTDKSEIHYKAEYSDTIGSIFMEIGDISVEIYLMCGAEKKIRDIDIVTEASHIYIDLKKANDVEPLFLEDAHFLESIKNRTQPGNGADYNLIKILEGLSDGVS